MSEKLSAALTKKRNWMNFMEEMKIGDLVMDAWLNQIVLLISAPRASLDSQEAQKRLGVMAGDEYYVVDVLLADGTKDLALCDDLEVISEPALKTR